MPLMEGGVTSMIRLDRLEKRFANHLVVHPLSITIEAGEFLTLLGPSGCGKTTILRMIAGFEEPTGGEIYLDGQRITHLPPYRRNINLVFQHYALFPHMTVEENIRFGLKMNKVPSPEQRSRVDEAVRLTRLTGLTDRYPHQLSGGQQQRVAIARAIVNNPKVLLLDEPLGALDLQLRKSLQTELKQLQRNLGITFIYVTHDQEEAMSLSDRIIVMNEGRVEQVGTPRQIYDRPASLFAATFVGENNLFRHGDRVFAVRPEQIQPVDGFSSTAKKKGTIEDIVYLGSLHKLLVRLEEEGTLVSACLPVGDSREWRIGQPVGLEWKPQDEVTIVR
jgi:spermidine/putrescine transport system ATP-binding protein